LARQVEHLIKGAYFFGCELKAAEDANALGCRLIREPEEFTGTTIIMVAVEAVSVNLQRKIDRLEKEPLGESERPGDIKDALRLRAV
jgi:hypothetical protein